MPSRPTVIRAAALLVALSLGLAPGARAQYFGRNKVQYQTFDFKLLTTEHFDLYYYDGEREMAEQAARMAERWYARLSKSLDTELHGRQPLILYASHPDFEQTNAISGELDESTGGVTESLKRRIVLPLAGSLAETDHVIGHELVHAFQYDLKRRGDSNPFDPGTELPLWFVEGMAEYLSVGADDPMTAMWMRDAARSGRLPSIAKLDNARYFPYRFGQAFWAFVAARYGEGSVGSTLKAASGRGVQAEAALATALGLPADSLSRDWQSALRDWAARAGVKVAPPESLSAPRDGRVAQKHGPGPGPKWQAPPPDTGGVGQGHAVIAPRGELGRLNVGPALSPDGERLAFLSERDQFSIELFLADARTGKVLRRLTRAAVDPHLQSLQFIHSAGDFSRDGRKIAIATVSRGVPALLVIDVESGRAERRLPFPDLGEIYSPSWSPDGKRIAFSAIAGGASDLFVADVASGRADRLTHDLYADLQPTWSPDGRTLAFATDRFTTRLETLQYGDPRLALYDLATRSIREVQGSGTAGSYDPQWSQDGGALYFLSDRNGISNAYRLDLAAGTVNQVTDVVTGVCGITRLSPALSVARHADRLAFGVFENGAYQIRTLEPGGALAGFAPGAPRPEAGMLPPARADSSVMTARSQAPLPDSSTFKAQRYRAGLSLDHASQATIGVASGSGGTAIGGGSAFYWSDMLGNHNLATLFQTNGTAGGVDKNLGAVIAYQNLKRRWNWGLEGYQVPYFTRQIFASYDPLADVETDDDVRAWQIERAVDGSLAFPFNRAQRFELSAGYRNIDFQGEVRRQTFTGDGLLLSDVTLPGAEDSIPSLNLLTASAALVSDNAVFGGTSPMAGQRYRLEFSPVLGDLRFNGVLADARRYWRIAGPMSLATRVLHIGRYGRDSETTRISPLFLGYPWLVRGYDAESFQSGESFDRLFGSRIAVGNVELRLPLIGGPGLVRAPGVPPIEAAAFFDAGAAWTRDDAVRFLGGARSGVSSFGPALRVNLFGFAVGEVAYVHPDDRPLKGWYWQFNLQPGF